MIDSSKIHKVLQTFWKNDRPSMADKEEARKLFNEIYVETPEESGVKKEAEQKSVSGCSSCFQRVKNGLKRLIHDKIIPLVDDKEYDKRLDTCRECPVLLERTFQCGACFCYLPLKALIKSEECEHKDGNKWK